MRVNRWEIYLRIIALVGLSGKPLREVEDHLMNEYGLSLSMARYYMRRLKENGWVRYRKYRLGDKVALWVEPRRKLVNLIMDLKEQYSI